MKQRNYCVLLLFFVLFVSACVNKQNRQSINVTMTNGNNQNEIRDSFVFATARKEVIYRGIRVYPLKVDSNSYLTSLKKGVFLCLKSKDTLFVLVNYKRVSSNKGKSFYPNINKFTIENIFPKYFQISYEEDLPYFIYAQNKSDSLLILYNKECNEYQLEKAIVRDSVFRFQSIKVGNNKDLFFRNLGLNTIDCNDVHYVVLNGFLDMSSWYTKYINMDSDSLDNFSQYYTILIKFNRDNKIIYFRLGYWSDILCSP